MYHTLLITGFVTGLTRDIQHNSQKKKTKGQTTINKTQHEIKDRVTGNPLITGGELRCSGGETLVTPVVLIQLQTQ
jgi:hypothetical protein